MAKSKKGGIYERQFCKELSLWFSFNVRDDVFWRTSQSGGRATSRKRKGLRTSDSYGDLCAIREEGKTLTDTTYFELKRGYTGKKGSTLQKNVSLTNLIDHPTDKGLKHEPILVEWWLKAQRQRKSCRRKRAFVVFRRDRKTGCIMMSRSCFTWLEKQNGLMMCPPYYAFCHVVVKSKRKRLDLMILRVEDFFKWCKPECFGAVKKTRRKTG